MSKSKDPSILIPGELGWELWSGAATGDLALVNATAHTSPGEIQDLPASELTLAFPVKAITALPLRVASQDPALFEDFATLHGERIGLKADPMAGQLTDVFEIAHEGEGALIVSVMLRAPADGEMPRRSPKSFDITPRIFPFEGDGVAVWKELGRWVFAIFREGKFVFSEATSESGEHPNTAIAREIRLALIQLSMQEIACKPKRIEIWSSSLEHGPSSLLPELGLPVQVSPRPIPRLPQLASKLLPADVRAARRAALKQRNTRLTIFAVLALYLAGIGWLGYHAWTDISLARKLNAKAEAIAPEAGAYELHLKKWAELAHCVDLTYAPVDVLFRIANSIPPASGLRLKTADISAVEVKLIGEAPQLQGVNSFSLNLKNNNDLVHYTWETPPANQSTRGWEFRFNGNVPEVPAQ